MKSHKLLAATVLALLLLALAMLGAIQVSAQQPGSISGTVYCDANHNYTVDPGEGVAGVTVSLWDNCNYPPDTLRSTQSTGSNGEYSFTDILPLDQCYAVSVEPTDPALGVCNFTSSPWYPVTVSANNPDLQNIDFPFIQIWEKWIDGQPWAVDFSVTAQTSDTIQVVDVISVPTYIEFFGELVLVESWNPAELDLIDVEWSADSFLITETGTMTWTLFIGEVTQQGTITKTFHVEPCTWTSTTLDEDLYRPPPEQVMSPEDLIAQEPVVVNKTPPDLWIDSTYSSEVSPGQLANFTLSYGNNGGYENSVMIRNDFPAEAPYDSADPAPDREAPDGSWVEWDVGDLSTGATGSIAVTVSIEAGLSPSTTMVITDAIYNHVEQVADSTEITFHIEQPPLSLGDLVWYDTDQNGIQDAGEPGVQGIDVDLYARDCAGQFMASDTTDANGNYLFQDLLPGIYCLQFSNIPAGWLISPQNQGADDALDSDADPTTAQITNINLQDDDLDEDMGIYAAGSVGDTVFCDANYNGLFDAGEGVAGVGVSLYDDPGCDGAAVNLLGSQDTTGDGQYLFASLMVGPPGGPAVCYVAEVDGTDPALGNCTNPITPLSYAISLDADAPDDLDADFGFSELLSLGDLVWYDTDQNGIQDAGEPGVQGVVATLYATADCSGGQPLATDTTDANGIYGFTGLNPGTFCIAFSNIPAGWLISPQNQGADDALDSDADPTTAQITNIDLTTSDPDEDMGIYAAGSVGDTVFCDANYNGLFDAGEGVAGVGVSLYDDPGCDGAAVNLLGSQDTTGDGQYLFASLMVGPPGGPAVCYVAEVDGTDPALGNCTNPITPLSYAVSLDADAPDDLDADFGFSELLSLGNLVWDDANANGIQDAGEPGVQGVVATLYPTADCSGGELVAIDTTDANGIYGFTGLNPGTFCIAFSNIPAGWLISPQNQGANPALDSDADPATGLITNIALTASDLDEDMGIYQPEAPKPVAPPVVPEASTLILLGGAVSGLAGYVGLQIRARRRKSE